MSGSRLRYLVRNGTTLVVTLLMFGILASNASSLPNSDKGDGVSQTVPPADNDGISAPPARDLVANSDLKIMPPSPELLERYKRGEVELPKMVTDKELRQVLGIDQPGLQLQPSGPWRAIALLVEFSDNPAATPASFFDTLIFSTGTGSVRDYYSEVSYGTLDIVTVNLPSTTGWMTMPQTYADYVGPSQGLPSDSYHSEIKQVIPGTPIIIEIWPSSGDPAPATELITGDQVEIGWVAGTPGANGLHTITKINETRFSLDGTSDTTAYLGSGYWRKMDGNGNPYTSYPHDARKLAEDAVLAADAVVDFSQYVNNPGPDSYVESLFIIHSGSDAAITNDPGDIWSHKSTMVNTKTLDGVTLSNYTIEPELRFEPGDMTIGVYAHELAHAFGLPDLYDGDYSSHGIGDWGMMAGGTYNGNSGDTPAWFSAWSSAFLGFVSPIDIVSGLDSASIPAVESSPTVYRLWPNGVMSGEYFLVENRQPIGFDTALPGSGLLIWHVDDNKSTNQQECFELDNWICDPNPDNRRHLKVALEQADGLLNLEYFENQGDSGDPFPGSTNNRDFSRYGTVPNSSSYYSDSDTCIRVSGISDSMATMSADFVASCAEIAVDPLSLTIKLGENTSNTRPLTITNPGGLPLNWTINEDDTACDSPTDISWLSSSAYSGTTSPRTSSSMVVTFDSTGLALGDYTANICINSNDVANPQVQVPVTLIVSAPEPLLCSGPAIDFEGGLPIGWVVDDDSAGGAGIEWTTLSDPDCDYASNTTGGSGESACADPSANGAVPWDTGLWTLPIDLSGQAEASLNFKGIYTDGSTTSFAVDVLDNTNWVNLLSWDENHQAGEVNVDLSNYAGEPALIVRFHYVGTTPSGYVQLDHVALNCVPPSSIAADPPSLTSEQGEGETRTRPLAIVNNGGVPLNWNIEEDDTNCAFPTDIPWLSVSPLAGTAAPASSSPAVVTFDSTGLALGNHTAKICINSDDPLNSLLQVPVTLTVKPPELLTCNGPEIAFESGLPIGWPVVDNSGGAGIVWTTTADPACGSVNQTNGTGEAACADSNAAGPGAPAFDTELWSPPIDLTGQQSVTLDVKSFYEDLNGGDDTFMVDVWDGTTWNTELSWDEDHTPEDFSLDLSAYAGVADARVRFHYLGNGYNDFALVDDVALTCAAEGSITIVKDATPANGTDFPFQMQAFQRAWGSSGSAYEQFDGPRDTAVDSNGSVYVADAGNDHIKKFDSSGNFISLWGGSGTGNGQLDAPAGVAVDGSGNIYVVEANNNRVQKFDSSGSYLHKWGSWGGTNGQFRNPSGVAVDSAGNVYVADYGNHRIQKFDSSGTFLSKWGFNGSGDGRFSNPSGVAVDNSDNVYVADTFNHRIQKFDSSGTFLNKWGSVGSADGQFNYPEGVSVDGAGGIYVADGSNNRIQKFDSSGAFLLKWGSWGNGDGQFVGPTAVAVDGEGNVYVSDGNGDRIQKFDSSGTFLLKWGFSGTADGQFKQPDGLAVDSTGNIYVVDYYNNRIQKFDSSGTFLLKWGSGGSADGQFSQPGGVAVDRAGNVYVADSVNHRIQKFDDEGNFISKWGSNGSGDGQFSYPEDVAVDGAGNVIVADSGNDRIQKFDAEGGFLLKWGSNGGGDGQFDSPSSVAPDVTGSLYVADGNNHRMQKFATNWFTLDDSLVDDGDLFSDSLTFGGVLPGTYVFTETLPAAWGLVDIDCSGGAAIPDLPNQELAITLAAGDEITCTFVNKQSNITVVKAATPADGTEFTFQTDLRPQQSFLTKWGSFGYGNSEFVDIRGVAADSAGNVYVTDGLSNGLDNHRVQKFDSSGAYLLQWGSYGTGDGQFNTATGVAVDSAGNVYVADTLNHRIQKFDSSGNFLLEWGSYGSADGQMLNPEGIAVDNAGNVYVSERFGYRIQKFDSGGNYLLKWDGYTTGVGDFVNSFVAVDNKGGVYVADSGNNRILKYDDTGSFLFQWGSPGNGDGQFSQPRGVTVDVAGNVYVADTNNNRIQKFDSSGNYLYQWGSYGAEDGNFQTPRDLVLDRAGDLYVADSYGIRIQKFATDLFTLDDALVDDGDIFTDTISFTGMLPGTYLVTEFLPADWGLGNIVCSGGSTVPDLFTNSVSITVAAGEDVACTFENTAGGATQEVALGAGWNMISSYLSPTPAAMAEIFPAAGGDFVLCKNDDGQVFWPAMTIDNIGDWAETDGYQCYTGGAFSISLNGSPIPTGSPLPLIQGWNTAAYWQNAALAADTALAACSSELVLAKNGFGEVYWPDFSVNQIGALQPGQGYQLYLNSGCTLSYPAS